MSDRLLPAIFAPARRSALLLSLALLAGLCGCSALRVTTPTPTAPLVSASAADLARAMQEDHFYSDYGRSLLRVSGTVAEVRQEGGSAILVLETGLATRTECDFGGQALALQPGQQVTVLSADASRAKRLPGALRLEACRLP